MPRLVHEYLYNSQIDSLLRKTGRFFDVSTKFNLHVHIAIGDTELSCLLD